MKANAAGITYNEAFGKGLWVGEFYSGKEWNPLTDDGDALRLAVKLNIHISGFFNKVTTDTDEMSFCENYGADPYAATRRAIVRAAAEIGKH